MKELTEIGSPSDIALAGLCLAAMALAALSWRRQLGWPDLVRRQLEGQGLTVVRVSPATTGVPAINEHFAGWRRFRFRRAYTVVLDEAGTQMKQIWMVEDGDVRRIS